MGQTKLPSRQLKIPLDHNLEIAKVTPELKLTDTSSNEYARSIKSFSGNKLSILNRVQKPSVSSGALNFGVGNYVSIPYNNIGGDITYALWFKLDDAGQDDELLAFMESQIRWDGTNNRFIWTPNVNTSPQNIPSVLSVGIWYRLVITQTGDTYYVYLDGTQIATLSCGTAVATGNWHNAIGHSPDPRYFHGVIDEVCIFSEVKDQAWVTADYNLGYGRYTPNTDANVEYIYHFDDNSGTTPNDSSGNSRDGTFSGSPSWVLGKVTPESSMVESEIIKSEDGIQQGEKGINTFGDPEGRTVVGGKTVRFNVEGQEVGQFNESGILQLDDIMNLPVLTENPTGLVSGDVYFLTSGTSTFMKHYYGGVLRSTELT
jgi:hypothetical protein